jgi:hypothetical protein
VPLRRPDLPGHPAGNELAQHGMQPARHLGTVAGEISFALRPHLDHRRMILRRHRLDRRRPQSRDRNRAGVVRVVLIRRPRRQQPHSGGQLRLDIHHGFTGRDELLGQQIAQPGGAFDRPGPMRPLLRPCQQPFDLANGRSHLQMPQGCLGVIDRCCGVGPFVRVDPDHHCHLPVSFRLQR